MKKFIILRLKKVFICSVTIILYDKFSMLSFLLLMYEMTFVCKVHENDIIA